MDSTIKRSANVSKPSAMDTTVHKVKLEAKGIACNLFERNTLNNLTLVPRGNASSSCQRLTPLLIPSERRGMCFQLTLQKLSMINFLFFTTFTTGTNIW